MTNWERPNWDNQKSLICDATHLLLMLISSLLLQGMSFQSVLWQQIILDENVDMIRNRVLWICYKKIEVCCYLRNAFLFHVYECISGLQPSFQCGVNMLAHFSIILKSILTKGKDTSDPTPPAGVWDFCGHVAPGWCLFKSDGAIRKLLWWSVVFPSMFLCDRRQGININLEVSDTGISTVDQAHSITLFFLFYFVVVIFQ